ncbi:YfhE family protein [Bacillus kexueae]|nr:YfhE family protein [Bacillus kexueae]
MREKRKKRDDKNRSNLTSAQEVTYSREFKMADRAGGYTDGQNR